VSESAAEPVCEFESHCSTRLMWLRVGQAIAQTLDGMTLADLVPAPRERQPTIYVLSNGMGEAPEGLEKGIHAHHG